MAISEDDIQKADNWLCEWIKTQIKVERERKEALLIITYDPRDNKTRTQRIILKKDKGQ